jgi:peptidyl-prolyl cis-trans isomerase A (cyclophilin A)
MRLRTLMISVLITLFAVVVAAQTNSKLMNPAALNEKAPDVFKAKFETSKGDFEVEVHRDWDPAGADRFFNLVKNGFFDDNRFFRYYSVSSLTILQFGINGDPAVAAKWMAPTSRIKDSPVKQGNKKGTLVFAKPAMPDARTTQLFINLEDNSGALDPQGFSAFGKVTTGMNIVSKLYTGYGEQPQQAQIQAQGNAYLNKSFPKLDYIKKATIGQ